MDQHGAQQRIVVIEDEEAIADAVMQRLRGEGFDVEWAADGIVGVELCERVRPDLVVLDLMLPGLDGLEVCRRIQAERRTPVLMLTARVDESDLLVGLAVGADDYLTTVQPCELVVRPAVCAAPSPSRHPPDEAPLVVLDIEIDRPPSRRVPASPCTDPHRVRPARVPRPASRRCSADVLLAEVWATTATTAPAP